MATLWTMRGGRSTPAMPNGTTCTVGLIIVLALMIGKFFGWLR